MNKKKRSIVILIIITLLIYNIIPIINDIFPNSVYYTFLTDLWIINSLYALISSIVMSKKYGFIYFVLAFIGSLIGRFIYIKKNK